jgi:hypothetical protein
MKGPRVCFAGARLDQRTGEAPAFLRVSIFDIWSQGVSPLSHSKDEATRTRE